MFPQSAAQLPREIFPQLVGPGAFYMTGEDVLQLATWNVNAGAVATVAGRFLTLAGQVVPFEFSLLMASDRSIRTRNNPFGEGWLLNAAVYVSAGTPTHGETYGRLTVLRGSLGATVELATLTAGYITAGNRIAWPGSPVRSSLEGPGFVRNILGTDPAAFFEIGISVPNNARWRLLALRVNLVTDATVANRQVQLQFDASGNGTYLFATAINAQTASSTVTYQFGQFGSARATTFNNVQEIPIPPIILPAGSTIVSVTNNMQAGDNYGAPRILVEEWFDV